MLTVTIDIGSNLNFEEVKVRKVIEVFKVTKVRKEKRDREAPVLVSITVCSWHTRRL